MNNEVSGFEKAQPFERDLLGREPLAETIMQLVQNTKEPFVLALDGDWGTGKTVFLEKILQKRAEVLKFICIRLNAWESDFTEDPLAALIAEIEDALKQIQVGDWAVAEGNKIVATIKRDVGKIARKGLKLAGLAALAHILKTPTDKLQDFFNSDDTAEPANGVDEQNGGGTTNDPVFAKLLDQLGEEKLNEYRAEKQALHNIKASLRDLALACKGKDGQPGRPLPILFFIDELDRCRPTYAIELLEVIKHLFEVEGYFFILAMNQEQLAHSIKTLYGEKFDSKAYLTRFFDITIRLPLGNRNELFKHWVAQYQSIPAVYRDVQEAIPKVADENNISTRVLLQTLSIYKVAGRMLNGTPEENTFLLAYLFLRIIAPKKLQDYEENRGSAEADQIIGLAEARMALFGKRELQHIALCFRCRGMSFGSDVFINQVRSELKLQQGLSDNREDQHWEKYYDSVQNAVNLIQPK